MTTSRCIKPVTLASQALACMLVANTAAAARLGPVVETASGRVRGVIDGEVVSFKGIPFANGHPTYQYRFSYVPAHERAEAVGATHSSDIQFVFGTLASFFDATETDQRVSGQMRGYWTTFAQDGVPDPPGLPNWPRCDADEDVILDFRLEGPTVGPDPARERLDFIERVATSRREDRFFDSAGVRIRYIDRGPRDGEPVVLVHGFTQSIETAWGDPGVIEALDGDHRVIALDCRGHGRSDKPHDQDEYGDAMVADVIRLLDHLGIEKAHVVGYSMGGRIVFKMLADHPERMLSAMPCGMGWGPPSPAFEEGIERAARSLEESGSIRPKIEHMVSDDAAIERIDAEIRASNDTKALAAVQRGIPDLRPDRGRLAANTIPCLCIVGEHDRNRGRVDAMAAYMANLTVRVVEGQDHMTTFRDPAFVAAIRSFIREHPSAPTPPRPMVIMQPHEGDHLWSFHESGRELGSGGELQIYIDPETHPEASASFAKYTLGVGGALPVHRHDRTEEFAYILSGEGAAVAVDEAGEEVEIPISAGYVWYNPPGAWHAVRNTGSVPFTLIFTTVPNEKKGLLSFFRRISVEPGQDPIVLAPEDLERLAAEHDLILRAPLQKE